MTSSLVLPFLVVFSLVAVPAANAPQLVLEPPSRQADGLVAAQPGGDEPAGIPEWLYSRRAAPRDPSADVLADPVRVRIPAIGVDAAIVPVGLDRSGAMQTPDFGLAGWYTPGSRPGEPGPAVVVAHVDSRRGPDVFHRLRELAPGDLVEIELADGTVVAFPVESTEQRPKTELPVERIWNRTDERVLRLITCGGEFDRSRRSYRSNVIAYTGPALTSGG